MSVGDLIEAARDDFGPAERRVAEVVLADPEVVAFGTVAGVAAQAGTSGATVVRLAGRLGLDGFVGLQGAVQKELGQRLRPATERIRQPAAADVVDRVLATELDNVHGSLAAVDRRSFAAAVRLLSRDGGRVVVLASDAASGVALLLATELGLLRPDVELAGGSAVAVARQLAHRGRADTLLAIDMRRYDRWVLDAARAAAGRRVPVVAITDSRLSPLASIATEVFTAAADSAGPFDSHVGVLAVANALVAGVAARLRATATTRLDRVERAWRDANVLVD
jgi:DNA-binding MurR/RpiR family transcriptional regulator